LLRNPIKGYVGLGWGSATSFFALRILILDLIELSMAILNMLMIGMRGKRGSTKHLPRIHTSVQRPRKIGISQGG
jgi:hypothetical protein